MSTEDRLATQRNIVKAAAKATDDIKAQFPDAPPVLLEGFRQAVEHRLLMDAGQLRLVEGPDDLGGPATLPFFPQSISQLEALMQTFNESHERFAETVIDPFFLLNRCLFEQVADLQKQETANAQGLQTIADLVVANSQAIAALGRQQAEFQAALVAAIGEANQAMVDGVAHALTRPRTVTLTKNKGKFGSNTETLKGESRVADVNPLLKNRGGNLN